MLKEGYTLPFQSRPSLTRSPKIINCYVHPHRNLYWLETLHQFMDKNAVEPVQISGLLQPFLVPKPHNHWRPILGQSKPNLSETIRTMRVGYLNRFQGCLLPYTSTGTVQDISNLMSRVGHTSSKHCLSVCPLYPWSSL